jgi:hypothetical protein
VFDDYSERMARNAYERSMWDAERRRRDADRLGPQPPAHIAAQWEKELNERSKGNA